MVGIQLLGNCKLRCDEINFMRTILISIITIFISHQLMADEAPACPDRRHDPDKFCPVGMIWSEEAQQCLKVV